jgi:hypothetical protein
MSPNKQEPSRLELYKAGKIEERRSVRPPHVQVKEEVAVEEIAESVKLLRPELIAIGLMVILLIILALAGM